MKTHESHIFINGLFILQRLKSQFSGSAEHLMIAANNSSGEWLSTAQSALIAALGKSNVPEEPSARHLLSWVSYLVDPKNTEVQLGDKAICAKMWKLHIFNHGLKFSTLLF